MSRTFGHLSNCQTWLRSLDKSNVLLPCLWMCPEPWARPLRPIGSGLRVLLGTQGQEWKVGRLPTFCLGEGASCPPCSPFGPCPHSPSCTVPITGVQTLDPIQRSKIALNVNQGVGWSRGTSVSYPPQEQGAGKTTPNRKSPQKAYCLSWFSGCQHYQLHFFSQSELGLQEVLLLLAPNHTERKWDQI